MKPTDARQLAAAILAAALLVAQARAADWPQYQCDAAKSGFQPSERISTLNHAGNAGYRTALWHWDSPESTDIGGGTTAGGRLTGQVVVANGIAAVGSISGNVYAITASSGAQAWVADAGAPVLHSCAIAAGAVVVATQAGVLKAFSVTNGAPLWSYAGAAKGYAAPPTVLNSRIYIGSKDGVFHCVNAATGIAHWTFRVGGSADAGGRKTPIMCPAAVMGAAVFFGAENMHVYALDTVDGSLLWKAAVKGQSFANGCMVASAQAGGVVIARTQPVYGFHALLDADEQYIQQQTQVSGCSANPLGDRAAWITEQRAISQRLADNPHVNTLWVLRASNGAAAYGQPVPVLYTCGVGNTPAQPVVDDAGGRAWVTTRSVYARFDGMGVRCFGELARLNLAFDPQVYTNAALGENALAVLFFGCEGSTNCKMTWEDFHKIADEGEVLTGCRNAVISSTWVSDGGVDLETGRTFNVQMYSSDDTGGSPLYGTGSGVAIADGHAYCRDSRGVACY